MFTWYTDGICAADISTYKMVDDLIYRFKKDVVIKHVSVEKEAPSTYEEFITGYTDIDDWVKGGTVYVKSSSANDTALGTGVRSVRVWGEKDGKTDYADVNMNGTTAVVVGAFDYVSDMEALTWGSGGKTAGNITCVNQASDKTWMTIATGTLQTESTRIYVPDGWSLFIVDRRVHINQATDTQPNIVYGAFCRGKHDPNDGRTYFYDRAFSVTPTLLVTIPPFTEGISGSDGGYFTYEFRNIQGSTNKRNLRLDVVYVLARDPVVTKHV